MTKLILTRGIPASGKSSWAKAWVQEDPDGRVRVNRDDLRRMLFGATELKLNYRQEVQVSEAEMAIAKTALAKGKSVVVDATNLRNKFVKRWVTLGYDVEFRDFEVGLMEALDRNAERDNPIPESVIDRYWSDFTDKGKLRPPLAFESRTPERYVPDESLPTAYIVDVDGTLAHIPDGGRSPYDYTRVHEDVPDEAVVRLVNDLSDLGHEVLVMSGRDRRCARQTVDWLDQVPVFWDVLHMRDEGDTRKDATVKLELFNEHVRDRYNVLGVFDDRKQVVNMWRDLGLKCFQVQEGNF